MVDARLLPPGIADERSSAFLELAGRLDSIDLSSLLVYRLDSVPASALTALAWQFDLLDTATWAAASTNALKREALRQAIALHRRRGTPWSIKHALAALGYASVEIEEGLNARGGTVWSDFGLLLKALADDLALGADLYAEITSTIEAWKNARSHLVDLAVDLPMSDALAAATDDPMGINQTESHDYSGFFDYDGTIAHVSTVVTELADV